MRHILKHTQRAMFGGIFKLFFERFIYQGRDDGGNVILSFTGARRFSRFYGIFNLRGTLAAICFDIRLAT